MTENKLLQRFAKDRSEEAFGEIVRLHQNFVYSVCRRTVGDAELAGDITQAVFLLLAEKAHTLSPNTILSAWLFRTAIFSCRNVMKTENRRRHYERKAAEEMMRAEEGPQSEWRTIEPRLDSAIATLSESDRDILMLRYADDMSLEDAGRALGISAANAQRRASRAVERLRSLLAKGGIVVTVAGLTFLLSDRFVEAAPASVTAALPSLVSSIHAPGAATTASALAHSLSRAMVKQVLITKALYACSALAIVGVLAAGGHLVLTGRSAALHIAPNKAAASVPPGRAASLTGPQVVQDSEAAFNALKSTSATMNTSIEYHIRNGTGSVMAGTDTVWCVAPRYSRMDSTTAGGQSIKYIYGPVGAWRFSKGSWTRAAFTTKTADALYRESWPTGFTDPKIYEAVAPQETINGIQTYHVHAPAKVQDPNGVVYDYWVDTSTFMVVKSVVLTKGVIMTTTFSKRTVDTPIPASIFEPSDNSKS